MFPVSLQWWTLQMSPMAKQTTRTSSTSSLSSSECLWCRHTSYTARRLDLVSQCHNWAQIMEKNWNRTSLLFAFFWLFFQCCVSRTNRKSAHSSQRQASRPRCHSTCTTGGWGRWCIHRELRWRSPKNILTDSRHLNQIFLRFSLCVSSLCHSLLEEVQTKKKHAFVGFIIKCLDDYFRYWSGVSWHFSNLQ